MRWLWHRDNQSLYMERWEEVGLLSHCLNEKNISHHSAVILFSWWRFCLRSQAVLTIAQVFFVHNMVHSRLRNVTIKRHSDKENISFPWNFVLLFEDELKQQMLFNLGLCFSPHLQAEVMSTDSATENPFNPFPLNKESIDYLWKYASKHIVLPAATVAPYDTKFR